MPSPEERRRQVQEEWNATHGTPTFDPNSADGYGPNQELPPPCLRFSNVEC
ncbi:hypothetical protein [Corynebacterium heidelbergense]|uniref:hypothetical protein n=1 Tax=Corynebacterium heidelbergense TaxID=2055947 RepID=UPI001403A026|nr:hypothetical protein [Corynebacterium heidelbergense]